MFQNILGQMQHIIFMKIPNKCELQQTAVNHLFDIWLDEIIKNCRKCTTEPYYF